MEACSLVDGAWYDVDLRHSFIVWARGKPCVQIKYKDFDHGHCELFQLEQLLQHRFRGSFTVAEEYETFEEGEKVVGLAKSRTDIKWFDAFVSKTENTDGDVLVTVEWAMGLARVLFGVPKNRVLSLRDGEIGRPKPVLNYETSDVIRDWVDSIRELSGQAAEFEESKDLTPVGSLAITKPCLSTAEEEEWTPSSLFFAANMQRPIASVGSREVERPSKKKRYSFIE